MSEKLSLLDAAGTLDGSELAYVVKDGVSYQTTTGDIAALAGTPDAAALAEAARDAVGAALTDTAGDGLTKTVDDGGDTIGLAVDFAAAADIWAGSSAVKAVTPDALFDAAVPVTLTSISNATAVDMGAGINFTLTLGQDSVIGNPTNAKVGQSGVLYVIQDGTGGWTPTFAANWNPIGAVASNETAGAVNVFSYFVRATDAITLSYLGVES